MNQGLSSAIPPGGPFGPPLLWNGPFGPPLLWSVPAAEQLLFHDLGPMSVVFNPRSGDTHVLDPLAREALDILRQRPLTVAALAEWLADIVEQPAAELHDKAATIIAEFDRQGLVFPLASPA